MKRVQPLDYSLTGSGPVTFYINFEEDPPFYAEVVCSQCGIIGEAINEDQVDDLIWDHENDGHNDDEDDDS